MSIILPSKKKCAGANHVELSLDFDSYTNLLMYSNYSSEDPQDQSTYRDEAVQVLLKSLTDEGILIRSNCQHSFYPISVEHIPGQGNHVQ